MRAVRVFLLLGLTGGALGAQGSTLTGTIVARETGERLPYAIVGLEGLDRALFANDSGGFFFANLPSSTVRLRVRRLGFQPLDTTIALSRDSSTSVHIALSRVAVRLHEVNVTAFPPCRKPGAPSRKDTLLTSIFTQLRMNAEQYALLTTQYPLRYLLEVEQSTRLKSDGSVRMDTTKTEWIDANPRWRYKPGKLVVRQGMGYFVHLPTLLDFADKSFVANHCFHYGGVAQIDDEPAIRLDAVAASYLKSYDVSGSIYLDPLTFQIRRTVLQLTMPMGAFGLVQDFEMTTEFREILPSISVIYRLNATQRFNARAKSLEYDEAYEFQQLRGYQFLKAKPGERQKQGS